MNPKIINALFVWAAKNRNWDDLKRLLEKVEDANAADRDGNTALIYAALYDNKEIVDLLIECEAAVSPKNKHNQTALMFAAKSGDVELVRLLASEAEEGGILKQLLNEVDKNGDSVLDWAKDCEMSHSEAKNRDEVIEYLKSQGAEKERGSN